MLVLSGLAVIALTAFPLRNAGSETAVRVGPAGPLLPPAPVVIGDAPPAAVEPGRYDAGGPIGFRVNGEQTGMEDVHVTTRCGAARLAVVAIAADGSFGASSTSAQTHVSVKGRFVRPDAAHGIARMQTGGCDSGAVAFTARLRP